MEYVLNTGARKEAYLTFALLFAATILLVVAAVYFDVRIPVKETERLREKDKALQAQDNAQQQFIAAAQTAKSLIDSMGKPGQSNAVLNEEIDKQLMILKNGGQQGNGTYAAVNKNAFNVLYEYRELSKKHLGMKELPLQVEKMRNELKECMERRDAAERNLDLFRSGNNGGL